LKNPKAKKVEGMALVVENMPSKHKALTQFKPQYRPPPHQKKKTVFLMLRVMVQELLIPELHLRSRGRSIKCSSPRQVE
jgi:hypothetical protein